MTNPDEPSPKPEQVPMSEYLREKGLPPDSEYWQKSAVTIGSPTVGKAQYVFDRLFFAVPRFFQETFAKYQQDYPYYHRRYRRVPTIDECYTHDHVCAFEADRQVKRDRDVEKNIVFILSQRYTECTMNDMGGVPSKVKSRPNDPCIELRDDFMRAKLNFYIKYGDMRGDMVARDVLMKQKHRLIWERRHGENTVKAQAKLREDMAAAAAEE